MNKVSAIGQLAKLLVALGMQTTDLPRQVDFEEWYAVLLDGRVMGRIPNEMAEDLTKQLRLLKVLGKENVIKSFYFPNIYWI